MAVQPMPSAIINWHPRRNHFERFLREQRPIGARHLSLVLKKDGRGDRKRNRTRSAYRQELRWRLRVCCTNDLLRHPVRISGRQGQPVQIDESMFNHKRRGGVGRRAEKLWVFGMADTRYRPARYHMEVVRNRNRRTLVPIINRHLVGRNVPIHSDMWRAYINLPRYVPNCGLHETVNHTQNFVDPITGAHIQAMESGWNRVKYGFKKAKGCRRNRVQSYLDEFMWIDWRGGNDVFRSVLLIISIDYPH